MTNPAIAPARRALHFGRDSLHRDQGERSLRRRVAAGLPATAGLTLNVAFFIGYPRGERETKKRQPPVPLPGQLLAHLRRWKRQGQRFAVEWNGEPVKSIRKAFARRPAKDAGLGEDVISHTLRHKRGNVVDAGRHGRCGRRRASSE